MVKSVIRLILEIVKLLALTGVCVALVWAIIVIIKS